MPKVPVRNLGSPPFVIAANLVDKFLGLQIAPMLDMILDPKWLQSFG